MYFIFIFLSFFLSLFIYLFIFILFDPFRIGKIEKLNFWDSNNSTNFEHQETQVQS